MEPLGWLCLTVAGIGLLIVLPIVLCVTIFQKLSALNRAIRELREDLAGLRQRLASAEDNLRRGAAAAKAQAHPPQPQREVPPESPQEVPPVIDLARVSPSVAPPPLPRPPAAPYAPRTTVTPTPAPPLPPRPPVKKLSAEEWVVRVLIVAGAVALIFTGGYLVKYSADKGYLSPPVRLSLGALFGIAMLAMGEWMRRNYLRIAQALSAAGVAVLFAVILAGVHIMHDQQHHPLIPKGVGFVLLAVVAAMAVVLSLRQGQLVAVLGLLGGFATPALIGSQEHEPGQLFGYLFVVELGLIVVTRWRRWWWLTLLALLGGYGWAALWFVTRFDPHQSDPFWVGVYLLGSTAAFIFATRRLAGEAEAPTALTLGGTVSWRELIRWGSAGIGLFLLAWLLRAAHFASQDWVYLGILGAGCLALGRLDRRSLGLAWVAAAATAAMLMTWQLSGRGGEVEVTRFGWTALGLGALYAGGAYACLWGSSRTGQWATLSILSAVTFLLLGYWGLHGTPADPGVNPGAGAIPYFWGGLCVVLAGLYAAGAAPVWRLRQRIPGGDAAAAALLLGACAFVALAVPIELKRQWISVSWAVMVPAIAYVHRRLRVPMLTLAAGVLAALVAGRLLLNPGVLFYPVGDWPVLNWILYGYGISAAAMGVGAWRFRKDGATRLGDALEILAIVLTTVLVTLEVRQFFHRGNLTAGDVRFQEWSTYPIAGLTMALGLVWLALRRAGKAGGKRFVYAAYAILAVSLGAALLGPLGWGNPLWGSQDTGTMRVLNWLLYAFGLPCLLLAAAAWLYQRQGDRQGVQVALSAALVFGLALLSLEIRQGFHPQDMRIAPDQSLSIVEWATYINAWLAVGLGLLAGGVYRARQRLTVSGLVVLVMAAFVGAVVLLLLENPLWAHQNVGSIKVLNWLLYVYGVPAAAALAAAVLFRKSNNPALSPWAVIPGVTVIALAFVLVSLQVRQAWHAAPGQAACFLDQASTLDGELYSYSAAWGVLGAVLLVLGILRRNLVLRWASLAVTMLTVVKVFLWDMNQLRDLWRIFSFLGLGVALLSIAYLYMRFVFRRAPGLAPGSSPDSPPPPDAPPPPDSSLVERASRPPDAPLDVPPEST